MKVSCTPLAGGEEEVEKEASDYSRLAFSCDETERAQEQWTCADAAAAWVASGDAEHKCR